MLLDVALIVSIVIAGLGAGIFLAFSAGVMPGLRRANDETYVAAMRGINAAVLNPAFLGPIFLPPLLLGATGVIAVVEDDGMMGLLSIAAGVLFLVGGSSSRRSATCPSTSRSRTRATGRRPRCARHSTAPGVRRTTPARC